VVTREAIRSTGLPGGFSAYYPIFKAMEQAGKIRRGYFVAGMGGAQFGLAGAEDRLREEPRERPVTILAACDPANAYGAALPWPRRESGAKLGSGAQRVAGAHVLILDGHLLAWLSRSESTLLCFVEPELIPDPNERERLATALAEALVALLNHSAGRRKVMLLRKIDDSFANEHWLAEALTRAGFRKTHDGLLRRRDREWERSSSRPTVIGAVDAALDDEQLAVVEEG